MLTRLNKLFFRFSSLKKSPYHIFEQRDLLAQSTSTQLNNPAFIEKYPNCAAYCGYDPTASSLHLGNLVSILMMARLAGIGIKSIFLVGGATGMIGDPSGKSKERNLLEEQIVQSNVESLKTEITSVYNNIVKDMSEHQKEYGLLSEEIPSITPTLVNNYSFYSNLNVIHFLRDLGKHFRMSALLNKELVANRLQSEEGISYAEFSYSLMQAYDFKKLHEQYGCMIQFGGSDQWGNITNGCELIRKTLGKEAFGITMPLLLTKSGQKFGKSEGNALYLNQSKTPKKQLHQYLFNTTDSQVERLLKIFTFYSPQKISEIMAKQAASPQSRHAQKTLADCVLRYLGGFAEEKKEYFRMTYEQLLQKEETFFKDLFSEIKKNQSNIYFSFPLTYLSPPTGSVRTIADVFVSHSVCKTKSQVKRQIESGGLYLNNKKLQKQDLHKTYDEIFSKRIIHNGYLMLRWGKKKYQFIEFNDSA